VLLVTRPLVADNFAIGDPSMIEYIGWNAQPIPWIVCMNEEMAKDRILETENLTDNLEDAEADWLINWAIAQLPAVLNGAENEDIAGERLGMLMAIMRRLNRIVPDRANTPVEDLSAAIQDYLTEAGKLFEQAQQPVNTVEIANKIKQESTLEALKTLVNLTQKSAVPPPDSADFTSLDDFASLV
jgi:hypothetical protein